MKQTLFIAPLTIAIGLTFIINAEQAKQVHLQKNIEITAPLALGEFFDKLTILMIKRERIHDSTKRINIDKEYDLLNSIYHNAIISSKALSELIADLLTVNKTLWDLEDAIREKERLKEFDDEFKQLAKAIPENNDKRFIIKRFINMLLASDIIEEKSYAETLARTGEIDIEATDTYHNMVPIMSIPISLADLLDRISILEIKQKKIADQEKLINIRNEYNTLMAIYKKTIAPSEELAKLCQKLIASNEKMWNIQEEIRKKIITAELDQEFIEYARGVYYTNDERVNIKHTINKLLNSELIDEKQYTEY
ncbi:hypothetical protein E3J79_01535 [Candidatus Dependentiae bacterium]|nr:MAG: hypothetical protein E3J79_01535 [Candidatus Dependentiae bacterium]